MATGNFALLKLKKEKKLKIKGGREREREGGRKEKGGIKSLVCTQHENKDAYLTASRSLILVVNLPALDSGKVLSPRYWQSNNVFL